MNVHPDSFWMLAITNLSVQPESFYQTKAISQCLPEGILESQLTVQCWTPVFICWGQRVQELETTCDGRLLNYFLTKHILHSRGRGCFCSCSKCSFVGTLPLRHTMPSQPFLLFSMWVLFCLFVFTLWYCPCTYLGIRIRAVSGMRAHSHSPLKSLSWPSDSFTSSDCLILLGRL